MLYTAVRLLFGKNWIIKTVKKACPYSRFTFIMKYEFLCLQKTNKAGMRFFMSKVLMLSTCKGDELFDLF